MSLSYSLVVFCALFAIGSGQGLNDRNGIINSTLLESMKEFPHQVGIYVSDNRYCSGSIISPNWILTAKTCPGWSSNITMTLMFKQLNLNISLPLNNGSFTIQVNEKNVHSYEDYNLALIKLPVALKFDTELAPVALAIDPNENFTSAYAVMPGIQQFTTKESYGKFEIISDRCDYSSNTVCTLGWKNSSTVPCVGTQGGGLLVNWPTAPRLVGVFSAPQSCLSYVRSAYTRVSNVLDWIESVLEMKIKNDGYF